MQARRRDARRRVAAQWHDKLDRVQIRVPPEGQHLVDTLRTALANMSISRVGPRLQPGTRSYSRAWIRDGAMIGEGLLRLGREDIAKDFLAWYAPYQFDSGKVPCCVDDRGADPVPENDSHGELVYLAAEVYRYTRDRALLESMWPHVQGAVKYMDELRASERTEDKPREEPGLLRPDACVDQPRRLFGQADAFVLGRLLGAARLQGRRRDRAVVGARRRRQALRRLARPVPR
jgi:glycogen debranching enzyme